MSKNIVNQIRKATRRKFSAEEKIRICQRAGKTGHGPAHRVGGFFGQLAGLFEAPAWVGRWIYRFTANGNRR